MIGDCTCCGKPIPADGETLYGTVIMARSGAVYRLCLTCLDALWAARNPGMRQRDEQGQLPIEGE